MKIVKITKILPVKLTQDEMVNMSKDLARENQDLGQVEDKKKDVVADFAAQTKKHEANISRLSRMVSTETEYRDVDCVWDFDYKKGNKVLIRTDTKEKIDEREITQDDRQRKLDEQKTENKTKKDK